MIKQRLFTIFSIAILFVIGASLKTIRVYAAATPSPTPTQDWQMNYGCATSKGLISFKDAANLIRDPYDPGDSDHFLSDSRFIKYCINTDYVGSLTDYKSGPIPIVNDIYGFCPKDAVTGLDTVTAEDINTPDSVRYLYDPTVFGNHNPVCCPRSAPFGYYNYFADLTTGPAWCCPNKIPPDKINGTWICQDSFRTKAVEGFPRDDLLQFTITYSKYYYSALGSSSSFDQMTPNITIFPAAEVFYTCPSSACFVKGGTADPPPASQSRVNLTDAEHQAFDCVPSLSSEELNKAKNIADVKPNIPMAPAKSKDYCYNGSVIDAATFQAWGPAIGMYLNCMGTTDTVVQKQCTDCLTPCMNKTACTVTWTGLGCVDSNVNSLVTRVFQIGVGIIGGVGMLRVMQAAIMRQSGDPAKIQESYDIISAVVIGFILLVGAVVILRLLGIFILPFDFMK